MAGRGLDEDGFIAREGSLARVPVIFGPVVSAARKLITETFGPAGSGPAGPGPAGSGPAGARLHSAYLYGSLPRGAAIPGRSDLDVLLALHREPMAADRADAAAIESRLDRSFTQVSSVGIGLSGTATLLSELERHDLGWFVACLCTPLLGEDLACQLPRYRPSALLARETNGDLVLALAGWRERAASARTPAEITLLSRNVARKLVRSGLTLVMPRWGGWTSDLARSAEIFARYYPQRAAQMRAAAVTARAPGADAAILTVLIEDLAPWLAAEYAAVHGRKAPRPPSAQPQGEYPS